MYLYLCVAVVVVVAECSLWQIKRGKESELVAPTRRLALHAKQTGGVLVVFDRRAQSIRQPDA